MLKILLAAADKDHVAAGRDVGNGSITSTACDFNGILDAIFCTQANDHGQRCPAVRNGRVSTKANKNIYHQAREALHLTRESASELLGSMPPERIEKIENERCLPHPDEVLVMAEKYKQPNLCNYYCANQCPIGRQYVPEVKIKDLSQIVLEMLASLNAMNKKKERLIEITVDGVISDDELSDFLFIQKELERISITVETLQLWAERMLATGAIDPEQYQKCRGKMEAAAE